jgi:predicted acetyltransferase
MHMLKNEIFKVKTSEKKWKTISYVRVVNVRDASMDNSEDTFYIDLKTVDEKNVGNMALSLEEFMDLYKEDKIVKIDDSDKAFIILKYRDF